MDCKVHVADCRIFPCESDIVAFAILGSGFTGAIGDTSPQRALLAVESPDSQERWRRTPCAQAKRRTTRVRAELAEGRGNQSTYRSGLTRGHSTQWKWGRWLSNLRFTAAMEPVPGVLLSTAWTRPLSHCDTSTGVSRAAALVRDWNTEWKYRTRR